MSNQPASTKKRREATLACLEPTMWKPGQSGNPTGKSKRLEEIRSLAKENSRRALERLVDLIDSDDERIALMAAREVLDRAWGKVKPAEDDNDGKGITVNIVRLAKDVH
ncbi:MAG: DUF5681 domain-containing protein [Hyphomicrobium sp.]